MKVGVLTAALQELTPREVRDPDPDKAIEEWLDLRQGRWAPATSSCRRRSIRPRPTCRPRRCSIRSPTRSTCASRSRRSGRARVRKRDGRDRRRPVGRRLLRQPAAPRSGDPQEEDRLHAAHLRRGGAARRRRRVRLRRPQPATHHGPEPPGLRAALRAAAEGGEGARADVSRRAVPDARLDHRRQLAQQHRLHAGHLDRAAPHRREARRRRSVPHPLRPVARHPDGAGHALDLPVPQGRGLQLPDRRLPREGPGRRRQGRGRRGAAAARRSSAATGSTASRRRTRPIRPTPGRSRSSLAEHELPGTARHDPLAYLQNRSVDWLDHQLAARELLHARRRQDPPGRRARVPEGPHPGQGAAHADPAGLDRLRPPHRRSGRPMFALQHEVLAAQGIPVQGVGRQAYRS